MIDRFRPRRELHYRRIERNLAGQPRRGHPVVPIAHDDVGQDLWGTLVAPSHRP